MTNRESIEINPILKFVHKTVYLYPLFIGILILYLSYYSNIGQYGMGFAFVLGSVLYYALIKELNLKNPTINQACKNDRLFLIINIIFFTSFFLSLIVLHNSIYVRPLLYFILITTSFFSIFIEIFHIKSSKHNYILLLKIIFVSLSFRIGRFFSYPTIPGSDTHFHLNIAKLIIQNGVVPDYSIAGKYSYTCLWHIFEAISGIILNANLNYMLFYSIVLLSTIIISLLVYCIVKKIYNSQIALIAVLCINIADMLFVQTVTNIGTSSIVYLFFLVIVFSIIQQLHRPIYSLIVLLMIFCMILSHQLSTFCVFLILYFLLIFSIASNYFKKNKNTNSEKLHLYPNTLMYFAITMIFYWSQTGPSIGNSFLDSMIYRLESTIHSMIIEYLTESSALSTAYEQYFSSFNFFSNLFYSLGSNFLIMFAIIGILFIIHYKFKPVFNYPFICTTFALFCIIYGGTYIGLGYLFIPHRFLSFLQFFFVVFLSYSTYIIYTYTSSKCIKFSLMISVLICVFFLITTPYINREDTLYSTDMVNRDQYTYSELKALQWPNIYLKNQKVTVDPLISLRPISTVETLNISTIQIIPFTRRTNSCQNIFVRQYTNEKSKLKVTGTFGRTSEYSYFDYSIGNLGYNLIYSVNSARIYQKGYKDL